MVSFANPYTKGPSYGFIGSEKLDQEVFFHTDEIEPARLKEGDRVRFEFEQSEKGPRVTTLERLDDIEESSEKEIDDDIGGYYVPYQEFDTRAGP